MDCLAASSFTYRVKYCVCLVICLFGFTWSATAQISYESAEKHKRENRRFLKEAEKTQSAYKESHLNTSAFAFKRGAAARKRAAAQDGRNQLLFDPEGQAMKPKASKRKQLFKRKKLNRK